MNKILTIRKERHLAAKKATEEECNRLVAQSQRHIQTVDGDLQVKWEAASSIKVPHTLYNEVEEIKGTAFNKPTSINMKLLIELD